jgi:predicted dehydrogenase
VRACRRSTEIAFPTLQIPPSPLMELEMSHKTNKNRRSFLRHSSLATASALLAPAVLRADVQKQQLHVACVGVKGMGLSDLSGVGSHAGVKFVGFCDIDKNRFDDADKKFPGVPHFEDYREMLNQLGDKCDAVIVSTPDHMHASIAMMAMHAGKHVYCQKPLTHTVWESRQMRLLAQQKNHSDQRYQLGIRLIQDGAIGKVREVHSWVGVQGREYCKRTDRPEPTAVPPNVNWDLWVGASPMRPFAPDVYHPFKWRDWQAFGSGALGDFGCHLLDPVFGALELTAPTSIIAEHEGTNDEVWPGPEKVTFAFPGTRRTLAEGIQVIWRDGGLKPPKELAKMPAQKELPKSGSLFIGEGGVMLLPHVGAPELYPVEKFSGYEIPKVAGSSHWHNWVNAVIGGTKTSDGFEFAGPVSETVQLGNVAARMPGKKLDWNASALKITNLAEANRLLTKEYRTGFEVKPVV